ncbi:hypothetical protein FRC14_002450 [Serendipita sp. 396]|nr:hypothetical protein FRC14_002450 [Serendipita sp. 396]
MSKDFWNSSESDEQRQENFATGKARLDQAALNLSLSQAGTSYAGSMAATSHLDDDGKSRISTYSYRSERDATQLVQEVDGRIINALCEQYYLPTGMFAQIPSPLAIDPVLDDQEWNRLDKQHIAIVLGLGGLYPAQEEVQAILAPQDGETKRILDLGCGTGIWTIEMAKEFPHAEVVGVDLAQVPVDTQTLPPNCRFEVDNINLGLTHFEAQFDVVHVRLVGSGIKDFSERMKDIHNCLKPGGMMIWFDADYSLYFNRNFEYIPAYTEENREGSWMQRCTSELRRAMTKIGSDINGMESILDQGLWNDPLLDPTTCRTASLYMPIGPWASDDDPAISQLLKYAGALMRQDAMEGMKSIRPLLVRIGWPKDTVEAWAKKQNEETTEMKNSPLLRFRLAWGRRKPESVTPTQQDTSSEKRSTSPSWAKYPWYFIYESEEVALEQTRIRNSGKGETLPPMA